MQIYSTSQPDTLTEAVGWSLEFGQWVWSHPSLTLWPSLVLAHIYHLSQQKWFAAEISQLLTYKWVTQSFRHGSLRDSFCPFDDVNFLACIRARRIIETSLWKSRPLSWIFANNNSLKTSFSPVFTEQILLQPKENISLLLKWERKH